MSELTLAEIGRILADSVGLETQIVCVSGSDRVPESGVRASAISCCLASAIYQMATGIISGPLYLAGSERTEREDPTVHGGDESGVLPLCYKFIYTIKA